MKTDVIITIDKDYLPRIHDVAKELHQDNNLQVSKVKKYGLIMGTADSEDLQSIQNRKEVIDVEQEQIVQLPLPDSEIQ